MFAVIFEVQPRSDRWERYLGLAGALRPELVAIEGFIDKAITSVIPNACWRLRRRTYARYLERTFADATLI